MYEIMMKIHLNLVSHLHHDSPITSRFITLPYPEFNPGRGMELTPATNIDLICSKRLVMVIMTIRESVNSPLLSSEVGFGLVQICRALVKCNTVLIDSHTQRISSARGQTNIHNMALNVPLVRFSLLAVPADETPGYKIGGQSSLRLNELV
jgi:hypothetical protein